MWIACGSGWRFSSIRSETQLRQPWEIIGPGAITPGEKTVALPNRHIVDAGFTPAHQAVLGEFPVFIAMGAEPLAVGVAPLVLEANSDAVVAAGPDLLDQFVVQFLGPFALKERQDFSSTLNEFTAVPPNAVFGVGE